MTERKPPKTAWKAGQSGNPAGKRQGSGAVQKLRASIAEHIPEIIQQLIEQAKGGDIQAARLLLERVVPPMKAMEQAAPITLPDGSLTEQGRAVLSAAGVGDLTPGQASQLLNGIGSLAKLIETDELINRIERLEGKQHGNTSNPS